MKRDRTPPVRKFWTQIEIDRLTKLYPDNSTKYVAEKLNRSVNSIYSQANFLGLLKSEEYAEQLKIEAGEMLKEAGKATRLKKGHVSQNKGKKMSQELRDKVKHLFFQPGHLPKNKKPIGHQRITKDGYIEVKVEEPNRFDLLHRFMWKVWNGPLDEGQIVTFIDGNQKNCNIDNLKCITRETNMINNSIQRYPENMRNVMIMNGKLKSAIKRKIK